MKTLNEFLDKKVYKHIENEGQENCNEPIEHYRCSFMEEWEEWIDECVTIIGYCATVEGMKKYGIPSDRIADVLGIPF